MVYAYFTVSALKIDIYSFRAVMYCNAAVRKQLALGDKEQMIGILWW